jgi:hypothetical protein
VSHYRDLQRACDEVLLSALPAGLAAALDDALAKGAKAEELRLYVWKLTGGPQARPGAMTYLAVEAFLEKREAQRQAEQN